MTNDQEARKENIEVVFDETIKAVKKLCKANKKTELALRNLKTAKIWAKASILMEG